MIMKATKKADMNIYIVR